VTLSQLPVGPSVGAAAAVLILGNDGVAAAAAGVLMTVTGTVGGLCFAAWAGADRLWAISRGAALRLLVPEHRGCGEAWGPGHPVISIQCSRPPRRPVARPATTLRSRGG
jgi:hypothetical protein